MKKVGTPNDRIVVLGDMAIIQAEIRAIRVGKFSDEVIVITQYGEFTASGITFNTAVHTWANGGA